VTPLESALSAWIAFHAELGVDVDAYLFPPATEAQIVEVEEVIGYRLPEDLRELYKIANGQWNMYDDKNSAIESLDRGQRWAPLFGNYDFMPLQKALHQYEIYLDIYSSSNEFNTKFNQANPDKAIEPDVWEVRESDAVDPAGWNPNWFTFAGSEANSYSVDLSPPRGGAPGQVVLHGADEYVLQVVGHSITDMMEQAVTHLSPDEEHRYQYEQSDSSYMASLFFDMDWRAEVYIPQERESTPAAYTDWVNEQEQLQQVKREQFDVWLQGRNIPEEQRRSLVQWCSFRFMRDNASVPPLSVIAQMQMQRLSEGELPDFPEMGAQLIRHMSTQSASDGFETHAMPLAGAVFSGDAMASGFGLDQSVDEAIGLFHQFQLESGDWSQNDFNKAEALVVALQKLPVDINQGYSMTQSGSVLSICTSTFDEETFKSDDICHDIDLTGFD